MLTERHASQKTAARSYKKKLRHTKRKHKKSHFFFKVVSWFSWIKLKNCGEIAKV